MILAYTRAADSHAAKVLAALAEQGQPVYRFDTDDLARGTARVYLDPANPSASHLVDARGQRLYLREVRCAWFWHYLQFRAPPGLTPADEGYQADEIRHLSHAVARHLPPRCAVINDIDRQSVAADRCHQLRVAARLGLAVPDTAVTNSAAAVRTFASTRPQLAVKLTAAMPRPPLAFTGPMLWTQRLTRDDLPSGPATQLCPGIFQSYIAKRVELRVTIVGDHAVAAEIDSQRDEQTRVDFRRYIEHGDTLPTRPHELTPRLRAQLVALAQELGLIYGAADVIVTPDGDSVFLEINPQGTYDWLDAATHRRITHWLALELANRRARTARQIG